MDFSERIKKILLQLLNIIIMLSIFFIFVTLFPILLNTFVNLFLTTFLNQLEIVKSNNIIFEFFYLMLSNITISSSIISGIITGVLLFLAISVFNIKIDLSGIKYGEFNYSKFLRSIVYFPLVIGLISEFIDIEFTYNDFLIIEDYIATFLYTFNAKLNQHWQFYFITIIKMLPSVLSTIYFIKLFIFEYFEWLLYILVCIHVVIALIKGISIFFTEIYNMIILYRHIKS